MPQSFVISRARTVTNLNIYQRPACSAENQAEFRGIIQPGNILAKPKIAKPPHTHTHTLENQAREITRQTKYHSSPCSLVMCLAYFFPPRCYFRRLQTKGKRRRRRNTRWWKNERADSRAIEKQIAPPV